MSNTLDVKEVLSRPEYEFIQSGKEMLKLATKFQDERNQK